MGNDRLDKRCIQDWLGEFKLLFFRTSYSQAISRQTNPVSVSELKSCHYVAIFQKCIDFYILGTIGQCQFSQSPLLLSMQSKW